MRPPTPASRRESLPNIPRTPSTGGAGTPSQIPILPWSSSTPISETDGRPKPYKPGRTSELNEKAKELCRSHASSFNLRERRHSISAGEVGTTRRLGRSLSGLQLTNPNFRRAMASLAAVDSPAPKSPGRKTQDDESTCIYAEPWKPGRGKPLCDSVQETSVEQANRRKKLAAATRSRSGLDLRFRSKGAESPDPQLEQQPLGAGTGSGWRKRNNVAPPLYMASSNSSSGSSSSSSSNSRVLPATSPAPPPSMPFLPSSPRLVSFPAHSEHCDYVEPMDVCLPPLPEHGKPNHSSENGRAAVAAQAPKFPQLSKPRSGISSPLKRRAKSALQLTGTAQPAAIPMPKRDLPNTAIHASQALPSVTEEPESPTSMRPRSVLAASLSYSSAAAQRARDRSLLKSQTSLPGSTINGGGGAVSVQGVEAGDDDIFFPRTSSSPGSDGSSCCGNPVLLEVSLSEDGEVKVTDGVPDTPGLRRHITMASRVEDLLELMTGSGWSLVKYTKASRVKKKSLKKALGMPSKCVFMRCGCMEKALGDRPTPCSDRAVDSLENRSAWSGDPSDSLSSLEFDTSTSAGSTPVDKRADDYLEKFLTEKEASELKLLLRFFNITLPLPPLDM